MTIKELLDVAPYIVQLKIEIRDNGRYVYQYDIAPYVQVYSGYPNGGYKLEPKERLDLNRRDPIYPQPVTFWAIDPRKAKEVQDLEITEVRFITPSSSWLYENKSMGISCAWITAYPRGWAKPIEVSEHTDVIAGQMNIADFIEGVDD